MKPDLAKWDAALKEMYGEEFFKEMDEDKDPDFDGWSSNDIHAYLMRKYSKDEDGGKEDE